MNSASDSKSNSSNKFISSGTAGMVGAIAAAAVGGYLLYRNRAKVQEFLESTGIMGPRMSGNASTSIPIMQKKSDTSKYDADFSAAV